MEAPPCESETDLGKSIHPSVSNFGEMTSSAGTGNLIGVSACTPARRGCQVEDSKWAIVILPGPAAAALCLACNFMTDGVGPAVLWGGAVIFLLTPGGSQRPPGVTSCGDVRRPNHGNWLMVGFHGWSRGYCVLRLRRVLVQNRVNSRCSRSGAKRPTGFQLLDWRLVPAIRSP